MVANFFVVGGDRLGDGTGGAADYEEQERDFLSGPILSE